MKFNWYTVTLAPDDAGVTRKTRTVAEKPDQAEAAVRRRLDQLTCRAAAACDDPAARDRRVGRFELPIWARDTRRRRRAPGRL